MNKNKASYYYYIIGGVLLIFLWFIIAEIINEKKLILPGPIETLTSLITILSNKSTYTSIGISLYKTILGFLLSFIIALFLGIFAGLSTKIKAIITPTMVLLKAIPTASVLFLFLVIAGIKNAPIYVVILISLPVLYDSIVGGIENIPKNLLDVSRLESNKFSRNIINVYIPLATNYILVGIASAFGLAFKVEIMAEILTGDTTLGNGIGVSIHNVQINEVNMSPIFAWTIIAVVILLIITFIANIIKKQIKKRIL